MATTYKYEIEIDERGQRRENAVNILRKELKSYFRQGWFDQEKKLQPMTIEQNRDSLRIYGQLKTVDGFYADLVKVRDKLEESELEATVKCLDLEELPEVQ